jgi:multiple sugar transport system permease protein
MKVKLLNTLWPLIIPPIVANTFGTFLMRQYYKTIPMSLDEAARIDGAGTFQIYLRIMVPLSRAPMATVGVLNFIWTWNRFLDALVFIDDVEKMTVPLGVAALQGEFSFNFPLVMAGATLAVIPVILLFVIGQKYFIAGISLSSGFKG